MSIKKTYRFLGLMILALPGVDAGRVQGGYVGWG